jgi:hypothetical protein
MLVLGMHRSGTSALTGLLGPLGCALPSDGIAAHPDNPKGYWEPRALVRASDRVFRTARTSWFDPRPLDLAAIPAAALHDHRLSFACALDESFGDAPRIAVKDPRLSRLVPLFVAAAETRGYATRAILMLRAPAEIARSVHARDRSTPAYAYALWLRYMIDAERDSRALPRAIVAYDRLLGDWRGALRPVVALIHPDGFDLDGAAAAIEHQIDGGLRHHRESATPALEPHLAALMAEAEQAFDALLIADDAGARARIDAVASAFDGDPRLIDDIVHDELRHRRVRELGLSEPPPEKAVSPPDPEQPVEMPLPPEPVAAPVRPGERDLAREIEQVRASGLLDDDWYRARYPEVADGDPIEHYLTVGAAKGYDPSPLFQTAYYARQMARRALLSEGGSETRALSREGQG